ncbi:type IV pilus twitching motility protein PilT [Kiritimatiellaeota bacterium B1221]|nr:type IV pilus twitching motility protein PilT [Kiritimatiellaeota bacterium B1221]
METLHTLLEELIHKGGSDLHLSAERIPMLRIDGDMTASAHPLLSDLEINEMLRGIMDERASEEYKESSDTDFAYEIEGLARFRVNVFEDRFGMGAVFRQIPSKVLSADELNLSESIRDLCNLSKGLVLVTGPTGSGKSTTLAAMLDLINRSQSNHIITIEDPIEFVHQDKKCLINQRQIKDHTDSFSKALRAALRQDPDIVMVGEMRDLETIEIALETAETGHLVFGTLHTTTAASTMDRIIDVFPAERQNQIRSMLSNSLKGVIAQSLCKKTGGGRVAAFEILKVDHGISALIRDGKIHQIPSAIQIGAGKGMRLLNTSLLELVKAGSVSTKEAYKKSVDKEDLLAGFAKAGLSVDLEVEGGAAPVAKAVPAGSLPEKKVVPEEKNMWGKKKNIKFGKKP